MSIRPGIWPARPSKPALIPAFTDSFSSPCISSFNCHKIICLGKIKETYLKEGVEEYKKRLTKYTKLEIIELKD